MNAQIDTQILQQISDCLNAALAGRCDSRSAAPYFVAIANAIEDAKEGDGKGDDHYKLALQSVVSAYRHVDVPDPLKDDDDYAVEKFVEAMNMAKGMLGDGSTSDASSTAPEGE